MRAGLLESAFLSSIIVSTLGHTAVIVTLCLSSFFDNTLPAGRDSSNENPDISDRAYEISVIYQIAEPVSSLALMNGEVGVGSKDLNSEPISHSDVPSDNDKYLDKEEAVVKEPILKNDVSLIPIGEPRTAKDLLKKGLKTATRVAIKPTQNQVAAVAKITEESSTPVRKGNFVLPNQIVDKEKLKGEGPEVPTPTRTIRQAEYSLNPPPKYPELARRNRLSGEVLLHVSIDETGHVKSLTIERTSGYNILDMAASAAVESWHFQPAIFKGKNIPSHVRVPIRFNLGR